MTIREKADVEIDKVSGTVSVCSRHALQHTNQRIVGAVSVLFVLKNHEEVNLVEDDTNQKDEKGRCYGDIDNIKHFSAIPASLSVVELPFGDVMNKIIGTHGISEEGAQFQQGICSLQTLTTGSVIGNDKGNSVSDFDDLKVSDTDVKGIDGNDLESSVSKELMSDLHTDESFSFQGAQHLVEEDYRKNDRDDKGSSISPVTVERKVNIGHRPDPKCFTCNEPLDTYEKVLAHCKLHNLLKTCPICSFEFSGMKNNLKRHCLSHMQRPIYKCPYKSCTSTFGRKDNLRKHLTRHEHKMTNPRLSLLGQKTQPLKPNRRKPLPSYKLPTLVKMPSRIDRSLYFPEDDHESIAGESNQSGLSELYIKEPLSGPLHLEDCDDGTSNCLPMKSADLISSSALSDDAVKECLKDENITIPPLDKANGQSESRFEKKLTIDSVISRISRKATLPNDFAMDSKFQDCIDQNSDPVEHEDGCGIGKISLKSEESKTYIPHSQSQGGVVFPERDADNFSQKYSFENGLNLNMEDVTAADDANRSNSQDTSDDDQSHISSEDVLPDDNSHLIYTTIRKQKDLPLKCKYCSKPMESYVKIMDHVDEHIDLVRHRLTCVVCATEFSSKDCLRRHARNHFGIKFQCSLCSNSYSRNDNLNKHMGDSHGIDVRKKLRLN
ncbi:hypothetical protein FSP39_024576 [Pinctada imbricata]|uniref:C2H2-type domain-containing protein n=1 Tax=Pinctada imbricata TaxID=66713 RepID=A0AA88YCW3_PINIB|nr:hypothetical protein FSP39_024576 [Pinctada imbricata]